MTQIVKTERVIEFLLNGAFETLRYIVGRQTNDIVPLIRSFQQMARDVPRSCEDPLGVICLYGFEDEFVLLVVDEGLMNVDDPLLKILFSWAARRSRRGEGPCLSPSAQRCTFPDPLRRRRKADA